jgi:predicted nucleic acid-binding protein
MSHLVDTDLVIDGLTGASDALAHLTARVSEPLAISVISLGELFEGIDDANPEAGLEAIRLFISGYRLLGLTEDVMTRDASCLTAGRLSVRIAPVNARPSIHQSWWRPPR